MAHASTEDVIASDLPSRILRYREKHGPPARTRLAELSRISRSYVQLIERGLRPSTRVLRRIAAVLDADEAQR